MPDMFYVSYAILWLLVIVLTVLLLLVYRHFGLMAMDTGEGVQRDGLSVGRSAPPISGVDSRGKTATWIPGARGRALLVFASPDCGPCVEMLPEISRLSSGSGNDLDVMAVVAGDSGRARELQHVTDGSLDCIAEDGDEGFAAYDVRVTPFAFAIDMDGRVRAKGLANTQQNLTGLLARAGFEDLAERLQLEVTTR